MLLQKVNTCAYGAVSFSPLFTFVCLLIFPLIFCMCVANILYSNLLVEHSEMTKVNKCIIAVSC